MDVGVVTGRDLEVGVTQGEVGALAVQHAPPAPESVTMNALFSLVIGQMRK